MRPTFRRHSWYGVSFQFTHPGRGATTSTTRGRVAMSICFNSRTPGGVRRFVRAFLLRLDEVSIHAPREGCDSSGGAPPNPQVAFQFTHPGRGATFSSASIRRRIVCFNSRTPGGVRRECAPHGAQVIWVSIHAPREGCDTSFSEMMMRASAFQFTHPGRGATRRRGSLPTSSTLFQFTHPGRGATKYLALRILGRLVSIHAPREGCD